MNVYISVDMEGISGLVYGHQCIGGQLDNMRFRKMLTAEVNAAIEGALAGGAKRILVNDGHRIGDNILIEELNPAAELISGVPKPLGMMEGIGSDFDAVFLIGYHSMAGTGAGVLCHTETGQVAELTLNGQVVGETGLSAAAAGAFDVPVVLVAGDQVTTEEARSLLGEIETVAVKQGISQSAARSLHPEVVFENIKAAAERALSCEVKPYKVGSPVTAKFTFKKPFHADMTQLVPGAVRLDGVTIEWTGEDMIKFFAAFQALVFLAMAEQFVG